MLFLFKDVSDLFGSDLPVEGATGGTFAWRDGPLLKALKAGNWVVFDEVFNYFINLLLRINVYYCSFNIMPILHELDIFM